MCLCLSYLSFVVLIFYLSSVFVFSFVVFCVYYVCLVNGFCVFLCYNSLRKKKVVNVRTDATKGDGFLLGVAQIHGELCECGIAFFRLYTFVVLYRWVTILQWLWMNQSACVVATRRSRSCVSPVMTN